MRCILKKNEKVTLKRSGVRKWKKSGREREARVPENRRGAKLRAVKWSICRDTDDSTGTSVSISKGNHHTELRRTLIKTNSNGG